MNSLDSKFKEVRNPVHLHLVHRLHKMFRCQMQCSHIHQMPSVQVKIPVAIDATGGVQSASVTIAVRLTCGA